MPFSVYVHVPFCLSRCAYCAFYSGEPLDRLPDYPDLLAREISLRRDRGDHRGSVSTVYFGGGSPALLGPGGLAQVLAAIDRAWGLPEGAEVSLEVNPCPPTDLKGVRAAGVNRLSLGAQSLNDSVLRRLGRPHDAAAVFSALREARATGFENLSADILYGIPDLSPGNLRRAVEQLSTAGVTHVSAYSLELHAGTPLARQAASGALAPLTAEAEALQWKALTESLARDGYELYEVSNFARAGFPCRHNTAYWTGAAYLGLGPGAHGFTPDLGPHGIRHWNLPGLDAYARRLRQGLLPPRDSELLGPEQALLESLFLGFRRPDPMVPAILARRSLLPPAPLTRAFGALAARGLLTRQPGGGFAPTREAIRRADGLALWAFERSTPSR